MSGQNKGQSETVNVPEGVRIGQTIKLKRKPYQDKRGRSRKALAMLVDGNPIEYVSWEVWEALHRVFARCATDPRYGVGLADAVRRAYIEHVGVTNGTDFGGEDLF